MLGQATGVGSGLINPDSQSFDDLTERRRGDAFGFDSRPACQYQYEERVNGQSINDRRKRSAERVIGTSN